MTRYANTFEGIADEAVISTANSGGAAGSAFSAVIGSPVADNARAPHGTVSMRIPAGTTAHYPYWSISGSNAALRCYIYLTASMTGDSPIMRLYNSSSIVLSAEITAANALRLRGASSSLIGTFANALPLNQWIRVEMRGAPGSSTTTGAAALAYYLGDSQTPVETILTTTTANLGTTDFASARFGGLATTSRPADFWMDTIAVEDAAGSAFIGPAVAFDTAVPVALNAATNWSASAGAILDCIADTSDATWAETATSGSVLDFTFGPLSAPGSGVPFTARVRMDKANASSGSMVGRLYDGATLRATAAAVSIPDATGSVDVVFAAGDIGGVTSWSSGVRLTLTPTFA